MSLFVDVLILFVAAPFAFAFAWLGLWSVGALLLGASCFWMTALSVFIPPLRPAKDAVLKLMSAYAGVVFFDFSEFAS